jgi:hypothetical protein
MTNPRTKQTYCECSDYQCPVHEHFAHCFQDGSRVLYRIDMIDNTGTLFCPDCADDAILCGLFTTKPQGKRGWR